MDAIVVVDMQVGLLDGPPKHDLQVVIQRMLGPEFSPLSIGESDDIHRRADALTLGWRGRV
jgi:hypothetical protein